MNNKVKILALFLMITSLVLAACGGEPEIAPETSQDDANTAYTGPEPADQTSDEPVETAPDNTTADLPPEGDVITMYIGPELVDCVGVAPQTCMQVKMSPDASYTLFYDKINRFDYEPGYEYELLVLVEPVPNPAADASSLSYTLVEEVSKTPVDVGATTDIETVESPQLEGTTWSLISYVTPNNETLDILPDSRITAEFLEGQLSGTAGCNSYFGPYEVDGNSLTIGPTGSTMMFCEPEEIMFQETAYLAVLNSIASYEIVDNQLHLINEAGSTILIFAGEEPISLIGTNWEVVSYNNGQGGVVSILPDTRVTALFGDDGVLSGSGGCNNYSAGFEADGQTMVIGPAVSTEMFCVEPEGVMEQETLYLAALQNASTFQINNDVLELRDANGALQASYKAVEASSLPGSAWSLLFYNNGKEAMVSTIIGTEITAIFSEDGLLSGSAGCNNYTSNYEFDDQTITIGPLATTRKMCAEPVGIMEQEAQYLAALENAAVYTIDGGKLDIRDANGSGVASYQAIDAGTSDGTSSDIGGGSSATTANASAVQVPDEVLAAAANASYPLEYSSTGTAQLTSGEYREAASDNSASEIVIQLSDQMAVGELSNGQQGAVVILVSQTGGTGTFYDLAILTEQDGEYVVAAVTYLGDRIIINDLSITDGQIVVDMVVQGQDDPFCCPTQHVIQTYELQNEELVQISSEELGTVDPSAENSPEITGIVWKWLGLVTPVEEIVIDNPDQYTFELSPDGTVTVTADCNNGAGDYVIDGNKLTINITSTTLALCEQGSHSDLFFRSLNEAALYFMENDLLYIDQAFDSGTMRFSQD